MLLTQDLNGFLRTRIPSGAGYTVHMQHSDW